MDDGEDFDFKNHPPRSSVSRYLVLGLNFAGGLLAIPLSMCLVGWAEIQLDPDQVQIYPDQEPLPKSRAWNVVMWAFGGALAGGMIALGLRVFRVDSRNIGTTIGWMFGMAPGLMMLPGWGVVGGKFSMYLFVGFIFAGSTAGILLGAIFDRITDSLAIKDSLTTDPIPGKKKG